MFRMLVVVLPVAPGERERSFFFRSEKAKRPKGGPHEAPRTHFGFFADAHVTTGFRAVSSTTRLSGLGHLWLHALEYFRWSGTPSNSGLRLNVENPDWGWKEHTQEGQLEGNSQLSLKLPACILSSLNQKIEQKKSVEKCIWGEGWGHDRVRSNKTVLTFMCLGNFMCKDVKPPPPPPPRHPVPQSCQWHTWIRFRRFSQSFGQQTSACKQDSSMCFCKGFRHKAETQKSF